MTVADLQEKFSECFPNFKIEFYPNIRSMKAGQAAEPGCRVEYLNKKHENGELSINSHESVEWVSRELKNKFGLHANIFRSEGDRYHKIDVHEHLAGNPRTR